MKNRSAEKLDEILSILKAEELQPLTIEQATRYLSVSRSFLYSLTSRGEIAHFKPGGKLVYFQKVDLDKWLFSHRIPSADELRRRVGVV